MDETTCPRSVMKGVQLTVRRWLQGKRRCGPGPWPRRWIVRQLALVALLGWVGSPISAAESNPCPDEPPSFATQLPVPDQARQQALRAQLKDIYDFSKARTADAKLKLARELFAVAQKSTDDPAERFVLLRQVMELAVEGGHLKLALQAVDILSGQFDVDALAGRSKVLTDFAQGANNPAALGSLVEETRRVVEQAQALEQFNAAVSLVETVYQTSRNRPISTESRKRLYDLRSELRKSHEAWQSLQVAWQTLKANPDDSQANLLAGRWTCLQRENWGAGLRYLAKSDDVALQAAAAKDLAVPQEAAAQVAVADAWYDVAKASLVNAGFRSRAIHWYAAARGQASGLLSVKIEKRLTELGAPKQEPSPLAVAPSKPDEPTAKPAAPRPVKRPDADRPTTTERTAPAARDPAKSPAPERSTPLPLVGTVPNSVRPGLAAESPSTASSVFTASLSTTVSGFTNDILGLAFSPDGKSLAATGFGKEIHILTVDSWRTQAVLPGHSDEARWLTYSPDGKLLASGSKDRQIRLWNLADGRLEKALVGHTGPVFSQAFAPDGRTLASAAEDATIRLWDLPSGQLRTTLTGHQSWIWAVAFSPNGRRLASAGGNDKTLRLWDVSSGKCLAVCSDHQAKVRGVAFLADGLTVATTGEDNTLRLWDGQTGQPVRVLRADGPLFSLAIAPGGELLAASGPGFICFWESATGRELLTVPELPSQATWALAFSPDRRWLVSGGTGRTLRVWSLRGK